LLYLHLRRRCQLWLPEPPSAVNVVGQSARFHWNAGVKCAIGVIARQQSSSVDHMMPYYEVHAGAPSPYLLMVHGFLSSRSQWRINLPALTEVSTPVLLELLSHGRSPAPEDPEPYKVSSYIAAFETIRKSLGAERWVVCGQSFGAGLAIQYAIEMPERVMGVIFTNSISALSPPGDPERAKTNAERAKTLKEGGREALEELRIHPRHAKRFPEHIKSEMVEDAGRIPPEGILRSISLTSPSLSIAHRLGEVKVPAMLVNGRWEKRFQPMRDKVAAELPGVRVVDLDGGHSVNIEAAEGFDRAATEFIAGLR
jgi:2-succinyl-6-hydroxy-2,4-cyclohexadiene-1-carboxylate synthase